MKRVLTVFVLLATFLFYTAAPCFADFETTKQEVLSNNPDLVYLGCGSYEKLWFIDTKSIQNRESNDGLKYWIADVYVFGGALMRHVPREYYGGTIKVGSLVLLTDKCRYAINKKQPQIQLLTWDKQNGKGENSWPFSIDRWEEFSENTLGAEVYKYVSEHGEQDEEISDGTIICGIALIIGLLLLGIFGIIKKCVMKSRQNQVPQRNMPVNTNVKFCRKCGAKASGNAQFCGKCGEKF